MPVEIRELVIKTEVRSHMHAINADENSPDFSEIKKEILVSCKRMIQEYNKRAENKR